MASAHALAALRRRIAQIEGAAVGEELTEPERQAWRSEVGGTPAAPQNGLSRRPPVLSFGLPAVDCAFTGGELPCAGAHEMAGEEAGDSGAALGFALALASLLSERDAAASIVIVQDRTVARQNGHIYAPGLHAFGLSPHRVLFVCARQTRSALWVVEEAVRSGAVAGVVAELWDGEGLLDLTATRRINVAARDSGAMALLALRSLDGTSAALTRWRVRAAPSRGGAPRLLGRSAFDLSLVRNRHGRTGAWTVEWNPHERAFAILADCLSLARPAPDRSLGTAGEAAENRLAFG